MSGLELLLEEDRLFIERKGWEVDVTKVEVGGSHELHVVIRAFPLPEKYLPRHVDILIRLLPGYPDTQVDMFWTSPEVLLVANNQRPLQTEVNETHQGKEWQRWSRHGQWRAGIDNLETFVTTYILRELAR